MEIREDFGGQARCRDSDTIARDSDNANARYRAFATAASQRSHWVAQQILREVYSSAPRTTTKAYGRAQKGLKSNEELTFSSRELDLMLPEALRLNEGEA